MPDKQIVAAFDFDGTLTWRDSFTPFLRFATGNFRWARNALLLTPGMAAFALGIYNRDDLKERVLERFFGGMPLAEFQRLAETYAGTMLPGFIRPEARRRLAWHQQQKHRCLIVSASPEHYLILWAKTAGIHEVLATRLAVAPDGRLTGRILHANCRCAEKVNRLTALLGPRENYTLYAYGDSAGDKEMLALADHAYYREFPSSDSTS